jgi:hypothetical protein
MQKALAPRPTPDEYLKVAASTLVSGPSHDPIWRKRIHARASRFSRAVVFELTKNLVLRVRDLKSGQVLAESEPGQLDCLRHPPSQQQE